MEDNRKEQMEALETLKDYNPKVQHALNEIISELKGEKKEDTRAYVDYVLKGVNWELQVINGTMKLLNEKTELVSKQKLNAIVGAVNEAYLNKDDQKLATAIEEQLLPFTVDLQGHIENVLA